MHFFDSIRYYFNFLVFFGIATALSFIYLPFLMLFPESDVLIGSGTSSFCALASVLMRLTYEFRGCEYLADEHAYIVVANHQSSLDTIAMCHLWPMMCSRFAAIARKEMSYFWPVGTVARYVGVRYINRSNPRIVKAELNSLVERVKEKKMKLLIYAEGKRRNTGEIHEFKKGALHMAIQGQIPILPVVYSHYYFLSDREKRFNPGKIIVTALPPIPTEGMDVNDIPELISRTRAAMIKVFQSTNAELKTSLSIGDDIVFPEHATKRC